MKHILHFATFTLIAVSLGAQTSPPDLTQVSLEDLLNIQVTSVSKKEQALGTTGAAVFVITEEDIRRSGATNIPDVLRMAPGVDVARINGNNWAVTIRGFSTLYADKVLVMIDGRSVYSQTYSGTNWNEVQVPLEDIERIEVIRGPGGTIWGANAVNGVINITTKTAQSTAGGLVSVTADSETPGDALVQYGGSFAAGSGIKGAYRAYGRGFKTSSTEPDYPIESTDHSHLLQGGFRTDVELSPSDSLMLNGDVTHLQTGELFLPAGSLNVITASIHDIAPSNEGSLMARWDHTLAGGSAIRVQGSFDRLDRYENGFRELRSTLDFDFQHHLQVGSRHDIVWGFGFRQAGDDLQPSPWLTISPERRTDRLYSFFLQDQIRLSRAWSLVLGSKFEHNNYVGTEFQPSGQLIWSASPRQTVWFSAARAIREPSRVDDGVQSDYGTIPFGDSVALLRVYGNPNLGPETVKDFGAGYRVQATKRLSFDVSTFLSFYSDLRTDEPGTPFVQTSGGQPLLVIPFTFGNQSHARNFGGEAVANFAVSNRWRLLAGYSLLHMNVIRDPGSQDPTVELQNGQSPKHAFQVRSRYTRGRWDWDQSLYYTGSRETLPMPAVTRFDSRLEYRWTESTTFSITGSNLLQRPHPEYVDEYGILHTLVGRVVAGRVTWRF